MSKRARTAAASTTSRRIPSSQHVISRRCLHSTARVAEEGGRGKKEEPRFNFNTSLYFTEDPDPDVSGHQSSILTRIRTGSMLPERRDERFSSEADNSTLTIAGSRRPNSVHGESHQQK